MEAVIRSSSSAISYASSWQRASPAKLRVGRDFAFYRRRGSPLRLRVSSASEANGHLDPRLDSDFVDVIGIGSRKDAVIDFCLGSPSASSSRLRFWTIHLKDSLKVQLLQRCLGTDMVLRNVEFPLSLQPCPPAVILVASAGHGFDHITAIDLLNAVKSAGGLAVAILLKPFSFEGQRRQEEVDELLNKLGECSHFYIVVEADSLLEKEMETLAEALESENNAVLLAINTISALMSEKNLKFLDMPDGQIKEVKPSEVLKLLQNYREAKVGFGAGYNVKASVTQAVFHCPFLSCGIKDLDGLVIFTLASACPMDESDLLSVILTFRRITQCKGEIIFTRIHEPDLEPNLIVTTLLIVGCKAQQVSQKRSFLSDLAQHFPFLLSLLGRDHPEPNDILPALSRSNPSEEVFISSDSGSISSSVNCSVGYPNSYPKELETEPLSKESSCDNEKSGAESSDVNHEAVSKNINQSNEDPDFQNVGPGFHIAQLWAKERASLIGTTKVDQPDVITLPVGVKSFDWCADGSPYSDVTVPETLGDMNGVFLGNLNFPSRDALTDVGLDAIFDIYSSALTILKRKNVDESRKRGLLSVRAASMLEAERESEKSWNPVMEMQYRGGTYRGRCQGGLPEGKGCLTLPDGSFYDGMWRYGKRSGLGTFCYSNGDVFQGAWRDDLMHGKGWFYFHTGDRWFANFWKGKANGEVRFYSKNGSIFFGHFQNGWRHGQSLCIDPDGSRWTEIWDEGVLLSRSQLDKETSG